MRIVIAAVVALAVSPAAADTAMTTDAACEVRFVRAPDEVRHVIESWLAAEPRCTSSIELRVVPTEDGFYLLAQRPDGRLHERVVPDAQSAGVLVASWVADDWVEPAPPPPPVAPRPIIVNPFAESPGAITVRAQVARRQSPQSVSLAAMIHAGGEGGGGLRGELDLVRRGAWTAGVALTASASRQAVNEVASYATEDYKAVAYVARTSKFRRWQLRFSAGAGIISTEAHISRAPSVASSPGEFIGLNDTSIVGEAAISAVLPLSQNWSLSGGPILSFMSQDLVMFSPSSWESMRILSTRETELMFAGGLRYSL
jgi:hypothetical protein